MSRIGKIPVAIPKDVKLDYKDNLMKASGPQGALVLTVPQGVDVKIQDGIINVIRVSETKDGRRMQGLVRSLIHNMVSGVQKGFEKKLDIIGVGYRADVKGDTLTLLLGYSHPIEYKIPAGIKIEVDKKNTITIFGADKQLVGSVAAKIRSMRSPDPYKGKGVRYRDEVVRRKVGKAGKK